MHRVLLSSSFSILLTKPNHPLISLSARSRLLKSKSSQPRMVSTLSSLREPLTMGAISLKNRTVMSSLTRSRAVPIDIPNEAMAEYYTQRAKGGVALIMTEGTLVSPQGVQWAHAPGIYSKEHAEAWKPITKAVHDNGAKIIAQLWHVGRVAHPDMPQQKKFGPVSAPSPIGARGGKFHDLNGASYVAPIREHPDPYLLVDEFRQAAINAKEAGFDGVEAHGANGYLLAQFFDPASNQRTDKWGGSLENRARFPLEVLKALIEVWGPDRVGIKLNPAGGYNDVGVSDEVMVPEFTYLINKIVELKVAYVQLVRWRDSMVVKFEGVPRPITKVDILGTFGPLIKGTDTKLLINAEVTAVEGNQMIEEGKVDAVVIGKPFISNPDWTFREFNGLPMNEELGIFTLPNRFYAFEKDIREGYTDYPSLQGLPPYF